MKLPPDPDQFKHFRNDPPEIKLAAWNRMQRRLTVRDVALCVAVVVPSLMGAVGGLIFLMRLH